LCHHWTFREIPPNFPNGYDDERRLSQVLLNLVGNAIEGRLDYSAIGSVVNLAARLCGEARNGQILVDGKVYAAIEDLAQIEPLGELALKGFHRAVQAFNVKAMRGI
jgi:class 3 adenylate cyclase